MSIDVRCTATGYYPQTDTHIQCVLRAGHDGDHEWQVVQAKVKA